jgi:hypothetical protein
MSSCSWRVHVSSRAVQTQQCCLAAVHKLRSQCAFHAAASLLADGAAFLQLYMECPVVGGAADATASGCSCMM